MHWSSQHLPIKGGEAQFVFTQFMNGLVNCSNCKWLQLVVLDLGVKNKKNIFDILHQILTAIYKYLNWTRCL